MVGPRPWVRGGWGGPLATTNRDVRRPGRSAPAGVERNRGRPTGARGDARLGEALAVQRDYVRSLRGKTVDLIVAPTFLRGIRRSGFLSSATALFELVDNSLEARASSVHVIFGFGESASKPDALAVLDDGHGMEPAMLRVALAWGGTHREDSRLGFGRFGYGLPSASMSQGRRFSVYSKTPGHRFHKATLDLAALEATPAQTHAIARAVAAKLPAWVEEYARQYLPSLLTSAGHGTVVVVEHLDNLTWKTSVALERNIDRALGVTYRNYLRRVRVLLQGRRVEPIDPLFLTLKARHHALDADRAEAVPAVPIAVTVDPAEPPLSIKVRAAYFPPTFARIDKRKEAVGLNANARFPIMKDNNGVIVLRLGRQIDVLSVGLWTQFQNNDRYWAIELDFPAELDEWFSVTTNKQRIALADPLREALRKGGLPELIEGLRSRYKRDRQRLSTARATKPTPPATATRPEANGHLPVASLPGGTFYLVRDSGSRLVLNDQHPFYARIFAQVTDQAGREGIEAILSVLVEGELSADPERKRFYREERRKWSGLLEALLSKDAAQPSG